MNEVEPLKVAISSCPNDTFAFYDFLSSHGRLVLPGGEGARTSQPCEYDAVFLDIEELNLGMLQSKWDIVKASFPVGLRHPDYELLPSGSAIGYGVGPIAVYADEKIRGKSKWAVGLPGENTTANFLWNFYIDFIHKIVPSKFATPLVSADEANPVSNDIPNDTPNDIKKRFMHFGRIMDKTARGELDLGVLIHEGRFVYKNFNLKLYVDLGEFWQNKTGLPVPLGGIFIKKNLRDDIKEKVKKELKASVEWALIQKEKNTEIYLGQMIPFIKKYSQESSQSVIEQHIETYVTGDTVVLGEEAIKAIAYFQDLLKKG